jgi:hypothetical protein
MTETESALLGVFLGFAIGWVLCYLLDSIW